MNNPTFSKIGFRRERERERKREREREREKRKKKPHGINNLDVDLMK